MGAGCVIEGVGRPTDGGGRGLPLDWRGMAMSAREERGQLGRRLGDVQEDVGRTVAHDKDLAALDPRLVLPAPLLAPQPRRVVLPVARAAPLRQLALPRRRRRRPRDADDAVLVEFLGEGVERAEADDVAEAAEAAQAAAEPAEPGNRRARGPVGQREREREQVAEDGLRLGRRGAVAAERRERDDAVLAGREAAHEAALVEGHAADLVRERDLELRAPGAVDPAQDEEAALAREGEGRVDLGDAGRVAVRGGVVDLGREGKEGRRAAGLAGEGRQDGEVGERVQGEVASCAREVSVSWCTRATSGAGATHR